MLLLVCGASIGATSHRRSKWNKIKVYILYIQIPVPSAEGTLAPVLIAYSFMHPHSHRKSIPRLHCLFPGCPKVCWSQGGLTKHVRDKHTCANRIEMDSRHILTTNPPVFGEVEDDTSSTAIEYSEVPQYSILLQLPRAQDHRRCPLTKTTWSEPYTLIWTVHLYISSCIDWFLTWGLSGLPCTSTGASLLVNDSVSSVSGSSSLDDWSPFRSSAEFQLADLLFWCVEMSVENINELCAIHDDLLQHYGDVGPFASASQMYETIDSIQLGDAPWLHLQAVIPHEQAENAPSWKKKLYDIW